MLALRSLVWLFLPLLLAACAAADSRPIGICSSASGDVRLLTAFPKDGTYRQCASVRVDSSAFTDDAERQRLFIEQAVAVGANAVVVVEPLTDSFTFAAGRTLRSSGVAIEILRK